MNNIKNKGIAFFNWSIGRFEEGLYITIKKIDPNGFFNIVCLGLSVTAVTIGALSYRNSMNLIKNAKEAIILNENKLNELVKTTSNLSGLIVKQNHKLKNVVDKISDLSEVSEDILAEAMDINETVFDNSEKIDKLISEQRRNLQRLKTYIAVNIREISQKK